MAIYNLNFDNTTSIASGSIEDLGFLVFDIANNYANLYSSSADIDNKISPLDSSTQIIWNRESESFIISSNGILNNVTLKQLNGIWTVIYPTLLPPQQIDPLLTANFRITNPDGSKEFLSKLTKVTGVEHQVEVTVTNGEVMIGIAPNIFEGITPDIQNINNNSINTGSLRSSGDATIAGDLHANVIKAVHSIQIGEYILTAGKLSDLLN